MDQYKYTPWRVLVTGSRDLTDYTMVWKALRTQITERSYVVIVVGDCPTGADRFARVFRRSPAPEVHVAHWKEHGKAAGPLRNQEMVNAGADLCLAFYKPGSGNRGTTDCVTRAHVVGIPVFEFTEGREGFVGPGTPGLAPATGPTRPPDAAVLALW